MLELIIKLHDLGLETYFFKNFPKFLNRSFSNRVKIVPDASWEWKWRLRYDGDAFSQESQTYVSNVFWIDLDEWFWTIFGVGHSEEHLDQWGLSCTRPADTANLFSSFDLEADLLQNVIFLQIIVFHVNILELNGACWGPRFFESIVDFRFEKLRFLLQSTELIYPLHGNDQLVEEKDLPY